MDILSLVNEARDPGNLGARCRAAMVSNAIELAASVILLYRRTRDRTIRAKHAAIACTAARFWDTRLSLFRRPMIGRP